MVTSCATISLLLQKFFSIRSKNSNELIFARSAMILDKFDIALTYSTQIEFLTVVAGPHNAEVIVTARAIHSLTWRNFRRRFFIGAFFGDLGLLARSFFGS